MKVPYQSKSHQNGAVLIVSMLLLLVMTILALSISQTTTMEERMAGNMRDMELAFQSAEASNKFAEFSLRKTNTFQACATKAAGCDVFEKGSLGVVNFANDTTNAWLNYSTEYGVPNSHDITEVKLDPEYIAQKIARVRDSEEFNPSGIDYYEVTSHSVGKSTTTQAFVQEVIANRTLH